MAITLDGTNGITTETGTGDISVGDDLIFTGTGNRITGDFSNATKTSRVSFQSSTTDGATVVQLIPNGTSTASQIVAYGGSDVDNTSVGQLTNNGTEVRVASGIFGTGTYLPMTFYTGGSERARIDSSGRVGINTSTTTRAILNIDTDGSNNAAGYGIALTNAAGGGATWTLQCGDQGVNNAAFTIRETGISGTTRLKVGTDGYLTVPGVYALTTGSSANVFVDANGTLQRSTSSLKYKTDVQNAVHGLAEVMSLRTVTYKGKNDGDTIFGGLIAEEVHEAGLTEFVQYAPDGTPDALAYGNMVSLAFKAIQELKAINDAQASRIETLEAKVAALEEQNRV